MEVSSIFRRCFEPLRGFFYRFVGHTVGAVVHGNHRLGFEFMKSLQCILRADVVLPSRRVIVGPDRHERDFRL